MKQLLKKCPPLHRLGQATLGYWKSVAGPYRLKRQSQTSPLRIVIGASGIVDGGWIGTDVEYLNLLVPSHWEQYFREDSLDAILAEHVWEHLTPADGVRAAKQCYQYLKPGGYLRVAVPDGLHPDPQYIDWVKIGGTGIGADDHKALYTYETFSRVFQEAGFRVELLEYWDANGKFHDVPWDTSKGLIHRSKRFDERNAGGQLNYTSIIIDAVKDAGQLADPTSNSVTQTTALAN